MRQDFLRICLCVLLVNVDGGLILPLPARNSPRHPALASLFNDHFFAIDGRMKLLHNDNIISPQSSGYHGQEKMQISQHDDGYQIQQHGDTTLDNDDANMILWGTWNRRRDLILSAVAHPCLFSPLLLPHIIMRPQLAQAISDTQTTTFPRGAVFEIEDPNSYSAVVYVPRAKTRGAKHPTEYPLLVVLHGAGNNEHSALYEFTHPGSPTSLPGDHTNLPPYLLSRGQAPRSLSDNFVVVAPYVGKGKSGSLYDEPRGKIISFIKWFNNWIESQLFFEEDDEGTSSTTTAIINRQRIALFGFSEGSNLAVELATTRQFNGVVLASYGFTGTLPRLALERLDGIPFWVFHSKGDDVYNMVYSNKLVDSLVSYQGGNDIFDTRKIVKYTRLTPEKNDLDKIGAEHVRTAMFASKSEEVYNWLLSFEK